MIKAERGADTFYNKVIDEFAKRNEELKKWFAKKF